VERHLPARLSVPGRGAEPLKALFSSVLRQDECSFMMPRPLPMAMKVLEMAKTCAIAMEGAA
jgi:hypothetical protein